MDATEVLAATDAWTCVGIIGMYELLSKLLTGGI